MQIKYQGKLPTGLIGHVRRSLRWIDQSDLKGLQLIELEDRLAEADPNAPEWHKRATRLDWSINGLYFPREGSSPPRIKLFARDLYRGIPRIFWLTPLLTLVVAHTVAHEVGHHVIAKQRYVFDPHNNTIESENEEDMAHGYALSIVSKMRGRWYYRIALQAKKLLAAWHSGQAWADWKMGNYTRAAESWYKAFHLDPDRTEEFDWHNRAIDRARGLDADEDSLN